MENKKPQVRFKGFDEEWERSDFDTIFNAISNNTLSREMLNYHSGNAKNIHYGDVLVKFNEIVDVEKEAIPFISDNEIADKLKNSRLLDGDIIISDAAEDEMVGKCVEIINIKDNIIVSGLHTIAVRPKQKFAPRYLGYYMNSDSFHNQLLKLMQGTKVLSISKTAIKKTFVNFPIDQKEQNQIGTFFENLDKLLTEHQQKHNKLKALKKAMLSKMFPQQGQTVPEIRFKGFVGNWEMRKLGDTDTYFTDGNYGEAYPTSEDLTDSEKGIPFLRGSNLSNGLLSKIGAHHITYSKHLELTSGHLEEDDIVIAVRGSLGSLGYVDKKSIGWNINSQLAIIRTFKVELNGKFLLQYLLSDFGQRIIHSKCTGTALKQLPIGRLKEVNIPLTSIREQQKIGDYFKNLDDLINNHQTQIEKLNNIKKAFLTKMFI